MSRKASKDTKNIWIFAERPLDALNRSSSSFQNLENARGWHFCRPHFNPW